MTLNCLLIDDEPLARKGLREYIDEVPFLAPAGEFDSATKAVEAAQAADVHLLFLDIQMPRLTGLQFFASLPQPPPVIFTTAYPQYALEGFELAALDYLVKPISFERFLKAALRAKEFWELRRGDAPAAAADHLFIKVDGKLVRLPYDDILYVEAVQNYVSIHTRQKKYLTYLTFHSLEAFLPAALFIKTHKSYLVAVSKIDSIDGTCIHVGNAVVPISRGLREEVMEKLTGKHLPKR